MEKLNVLRYLSWTIIFNDSYILNLILTFELFTQIKFILMQRNDIQNKNVKTKKLCNQTKC